MKMARGVWGEAWAWLLREAGRSRTVYQCIVGGGGESLLCQVQKKGTGGGVRGQSQESLGMKKVREGSVKLRV